MKRAWWTLALVAMVGCGGGTVTPDTALVEVRGKAITARQLSEFVQALPENLRSKSAGSQAAEEYLRSLVDRELLVGEARKRSVQELPGYTRVLGELTNKRLIERRSNELIAQQVQITEQDLKDTYQRLGVGWEVWPAHILSATEADAREVIRKLQAGADFSELARQRSRAADASKGGNLGGFFGQDDAVPALRDATFGKPVGFISEPIHTRDGWEVVKVLDRRETPFEKVRGSILSRLRQQRMAEKQMQVLAGLRSDYGVRFNTPNLAAALLLRANGVSSGADPGAAVAEYKGGRVTVGTLVESLAKDRRAAVVRDTAAARRYVEREILADSLLLLSAREAGYAQEPDMVAWRERKSEELLVSQLRMDEVVRRVEVSDDEAMRFYDEHLVDYTAVPGPIELTEVIVETKDEADRVLRAAQGGERLEALATRYSLRPRMEPVNGHAVGEGGKMRIDTLISSPYREFFGDNNTEAVGKLQGPLKVQERYSVFRLDKPVALIPFTFAQARVRVIRRLRNEREAARFGAFMDSLRSAEAEQITWHTKRIEQYAEQTAKPK